MTTLHMRALGIAAAAAVLACGCASVDDGGLGKAADLGEAKQDFEQSSQGGLYHFQYVQDGADGFRTVLWRQGESLSDDAKDEKLVSGVVRSVFLDKFCKDMKQPVALSEGSPSPVGVAGKWQASLRCAQPPPPPPKAKPEKKKPAEKKPEVASGAGSETTTGSTGSGSGETKPKAKKAAPIQDSSRPMVCERTSSGFECKPK